ncbi:unnamed protein product [Didymodactylos carnosus]|uniref:Uncharacterized protein n=1 Tax=Didymodactylos carnosus TaxID=1234261 RepID=A0A815A9J9_9BILA|nr:unnamed protein product [Didymodactylos carnosus]CAF1251767.1 unnamed protein product [Didymodactylos carnosus]CAF3834870.1 unnamed protein product [Didymodactylos carnosus]CAF4021549.1 unnamed protein product [Didymodactylos carnosus]
MDHNSIDARSSFVNCDLNVNLNMYEDKPEMIQNKSIQTIGKQLANSGSQKLTNARVTRVQEKIILNWEKEMTTSPFTDLKLFWSGKLWEPFGSIGKILDTILCEATIIINTQNVSDYMVLSKSCWTSDEPAYIDHPELLKNLKIQQLIKGVVVERLATIHELELKDVEVKNVRTIDNSQRKIIDFVGRPAFFTNSITYCQVKINTHEQIDESTCVTIPQDE